MNLSVNLIITDVEDTKVSSKRFVQILSMEYLDGMLFFIIKIIS